MAEGRSKRGTAAARCRARRRSSCTAQPQCRGLPSGTVGLDQAQGMCGVACGVQHWWRHGQVARRHGGVLRLDASGGTQWSRRRRAGIHATAAGRWQRLRCAARLRRAHQDSCRPSARGGRPLHRPRGTHARRRAPPTRSAWCRCRMVPLHLPPAVSPRLALRSLLSGSFSRCSRARGRADRRCVHRWRRVARTPGW